MVGILNYFKKINKMILIKQMAHYIEFVKCSANKQQQRLYGMYDVIIVLLFILYTGLENLIDESCKTCKSRSYKPHVLLTYICKYRS